MRFNKINYNVLDLFYRRSKYNQNSFHTDTFTHEIAHLRTTLTSKKNTTQYYKTQERTKYNAKFIKQ